jgi:hypothetical protein
MSPHPSSRLAYSIENFNQTMALLIADPSKHEMLFQNWRNAISAQLLLEEKETMFLNGLEQKSIRMVALAIKSIIHSGGRLYLQKNPEAGTTDMIAENIRIFRPEINILICRFDGFFKHCKWFPGR